MELSHMDEFIDELLREERACDVILPRIQVTHLYIAESIIQSLNLYKFYCYFFRLYVLFSQLRPRDVLQTICHWLVINYA